MAAIGNWDNSNCVLAFLPQCLEQGTNPSSFNTGNTSFLYRGPSAGGSETGDLTNMASGYGYVDGGYVKFDGTNDFIGVNNFSNTVTTSSKFTIAMRVKLNAEPTANKTVFSASNASGDLINIFFRNLSDVLRFQVYEAAGGDNSYVDSSVDALNYGGYDVVHLVYDQGTLKLYLNGVEDSNSQDNYTGGSLAFDLLDIGRANGGGNEWLGEMSWLVFYDDAISTDRITADNTNADNFYGLLGYSDAPGTDEVFDSLVAPSSGITLPIISKNGIHSPVFGGQVITG